MFDLLSFLLDIPSLRAEFTPRARHDGESPYWRFMGILLLGADLAVLLLGDITESMPALLATIALSLWLVAHLVIRSSRHRDNRG